MIKKITILISSILFWGIIQAQELQVRVTVNATRINTTIDKKVFTTLQNQLNDFINGRKWTGDNFKQNEKINCSFLLSLESIVEPNVYKGTLTIQAGRPIYGSTYQSPLVNYNDQSITFKYVEYQPISFNENQIH